MCASKPQSWHCVDSLGTPKINPEKLHFFWCVSILFKFFLIISKFPTCIQLILMLSTHILSLPTLLSPFPTREVSPKTPCPPLGFMFKCVICFLFSVRMYLKKSLLILSSDITYLLFIIV